MGAGSETGAGSQDDDGDPRWPDSVASKMTVDARRAPGARFREVGRRGVGAAGGTGSSDVFVNVDIRDFTILTLAVSS